MVRVNQLEGHEVPLMPVVNAVLREYKPRLERTMGGSVRIRVNPLIGSYNFAKIEIHSKEAAGGFEIEQMPGCCAIGTTSYAWADNPQLLDLFTEIREEIGRRAKWGILIATLTDGQKAQNALLHGRGWVRGYEKFANPKTGNGINIWIKDFTL